MEYAVKMKEFEGPLEVLLELIEGRRLSINEVSLASVTDEYFEYIKNLKTGEGSYHEKIASFLVVAATLILIKSRSLLAGFVLTQEEDADIRELESRLEIYRQIKIMAARLGERQAGRRSLYTRGPAALPEALFVVPAKKLEIFQLLGIIENLIRTLPQKEELPQKIVKKIISLEEKIDELKGRIEEGVVKTFHDFIGGKGERVNVVVSFLAMLELIKLGVIAVRQGGLFDIIHIEHGKAGKNN